MLRVARLASFKYPALPRYFFPAAVIADEPGCLTLFHPYGAPIWGYKQQAVYRIEIQTLHLLYPDKDYNLMLVWDRDWSFLYYYVNISLPMTWNGETCRYVDLDIDIVAWSAESRAVGDGERQPGWMILDEDEFAERRHQYSDELVRRVEAARQEVVGLISAGAYPFDGSLTTWRPAPQACELAGWPDRTALWHFL